MTRLTVQKVKISYRTQVNDARPVRRLEKVGEGGDVNSDYASVLCTLLTRSMTHLVDYNTRLIGDERWVHAKDSDAVQLFVTGGLP